MRTRFIARTIGALIALLLLVFLPLPAQTPTEYQPVGNMSQLMINILYPTSNAIFYIERNAPKSDSEWSLVQDQALMLAESGNLLLMPGRARDQAGWVKDAKLLIDAGNAAYKAAKAKDMPAILALNDQLNTACVSCHEDYRPAYRKRRQQNQEKQNQEQNKQ